MKLYVIDYPENDCLAAIHLTLESAKSYAKAVYLNYKPLGMGPDDELDYIIIHEVEPSEGLLPKFQKGGKYFASDTPGGYCRSWNFNFETLEFELEDDEPS